MKYEVVYIFALGNVKTSKQLTFELAKNCCFIVCLYFIRKKPRQISLICQVAKQRSIA